MELIETRYFLRKRKKILSQAEWGSLCLALAKNPEGGDRIVGAGGVRKLRLARDGSGKSGGFRVIYFYYQPEKPIFLLDIYAKSNQTNITVSQAKALAMLAKQLKEAQDEKERF